MSNLPSIKISDFKNLSAAEIRTMKSCELIADGEYVCTVIIPPKDGGMTVTDHILARAEQVGFSGNTVGGKDYSQIVGG